MRGQSLQTYEKNIGQLLTTEVVILAGGRGVRLSSAVSDRPKPMADINGTPFLSHLMNFWVGKRIDHFILSLGYMHETIINYFGATFEGIPITYTVEKTPLGTGGALLLAAEEISESVFFLVNGDTFFDLNTRKMMIEHSQEAADLSIAVFQLKRNTRYGSVDIGANGEITRFRRKKEKSTNSWVNGGTYVMNKEWIADCCIKEEKISLEAEMIPKLLVSGRKIHAYRTGAGAGFIDIGVPEDYLRASSILGKLCSGKN